jgi:Tfp pilus assembly major pilin PilA
MQNRNPYAAPQTNVTGGDDGPAEYGDLKILSTSGRLGRVRYIGYSAGMSVLIMLVAGILAGVGAFVDPSLTLIVAGLGYIAVIVVQFLLTIQRSHDMNVTGWLSLIWLIPFGVLVFWLVPGTQGENTYGKPPPPNTVGVIVLACILPLVGIVGILAAIAVPAYQDYAIRAQVTEGLNLAAEPRAAVTETYLRTRSAPGDRLDAGLSADAADSAGQYVEGVNVARGTLLVSYGSNANSMIAGRILALQPYVRDDESVVWRCAGGPEPEGAAPMDPRAPTSAAETDIESRFLPSACRP